VWAVGAGAELRQTLGTAVFAGMIGVTVFGLIFTPAFYVICRWIATKSSRRQAPATPEQQPAE
jgi:Cu/Ag efflux pump CusA